MTDHEDDPYDWVRDEENTEAARAYDDRTDAKEWAIQEGCSRDGRHYREGN